MTPQEAQDRMSGNRRWVALLPSHAAVMLVELHKDQALVCHPGKGSHERTEWFHLDKLAGSPTLDATRNAVIRSARVPDAPVAEPRRPEHRPDRKPRGTKLRDAIKEQTLEAVLVETGSAPVTSPVLVTIDSKPQPAEDPLFAKFKAILAQRTEALDLRAEVDRLGQERDLAREMAATAESAYQAAVKALEGRRKDLVALKGLIDKELDL